MDDPVPVPKLLLQTVFDVAVESLDFSSGFLGDDEVYALRDVAVLLGVDPMTGTPTAYAHRMAHEFRAGAHPNGRCGWCGKPEPDSVHDPDIRDRDRPRIVTP